jgi:hypothetical protein
LLLEHYLKLQRTKIATPREITVPKNLDFTDPVYRKKLRLPLAKLGAFVRQYFVSLCWLLQSFQVRSRKAEMRAASSFLRAPEQTTDTKTPD